MKVIMTNNKNTKKRKYNNKIMKMLLRYSNRIKRYKTLKNKHYSKIRKK